MSVQAARQKSATLVAHQKEIAPDAADGYFGAFGPLHAQVHLSELLSASKKVEPDDGARLTQCWSSKELLRIAQDDPEVAKHLRPDDLNELRRGLNPHMERLVEAATAVLAGKEALSFALPKSEIFHDKRTKHLAAMKLPAAFKEMAYLIRNFPDPYDHPTPLVKGLVINKRLAAADDLEALAKQTLPPDQLSAKLPQFAKKYWNGGDGSPLVRAIETLHERVSALADDVAQEKVAQRKGDRTA